MNSTPTILQRRRRFLQHVAASSLFFLTPGAFAERLARTPSQTEGPFYPDHLPLDTDNDLLVLNDSITPAVGAVTWLSGRVLDTRGHPIREATVEIWQCDNHGVYLHSGSAQKDRQDRNFQGFGRFVTGSSGEYLFRTIKPVPYPGRTPHIHFALKTRGREKFTTQCYIRGEPQNATDGIWKGVTDRKQRDAITVPFTPLRGSKIGELTARFDLVLDYTPSL